MPASGGFGKSSAACRQDRDEPGALERALGAGTDALVAVFSAPEALPTLDELADPVAWLMRMGLPVLAGAEPAQLADGPEPA